MEKYRLFPVGKIRYIHEDKYRGAIIAESTGNPVISVSTSTVTHEPRLMATSLYYPSSTAIAAIIYWDPDINKTKVHIGSISGGESFRVEQLQRPPPGKVVSPKVRYMVFQTPETLEKLGRREDHYKWIYDDTTRGWELWVSQGPSPLNTRKCIAVMFKDTDGNRKFKMVKGHEALFNDHEELDAFRLNVLLAYVLTFHGCFFRNGAAAQV